MPHMMRTYTSSSGIMWPRHLVASCGHMPRLALAVFAGTVAVLTAVVSMLQPCETWINTEHIHVMAYSIDIPSLGDFFEIYDGRDATVPLLGSC